MSHNHIFKYFHFKFYVYNLTWHFWHLRIKINSEFLLSAQFSSPIENPFKPLPPPRGVGY
jgi:hypothetical protein